MSKMKISVIVPAYNVEKYIERCIESIIRQNLKEIEIIVIDDASTDNTGIIIQQKFGGDKRLRIIRHERNFGLGVARNTGLKHANGQYVFFIDSDDWISENALNKLYTIAIDERADIVACGIKLVFEDGSTKPYHAVAFNTRGNVDGLNALLDGKISVTAWNKLYRKEMLDKHNLLFPPIYHEDMIFAMEAVYYSKSFISISDELYNYYQTPQSITRSKLSEKHISSYIEIFKLMKDFIEKLKLDGNEENKELIRKLIRYQSVWTVYNLKNLYRQTDLSEREKILSKVFIDQFDSSCYFIQGLLNYFMEENFRFATLYNKPLEVLKRIKQKKIILFGTGSASKNVFESFPLQVSYCIDNNSEKWKLEYHGLPIFSPKQLLKENSNSIAIIVASQYYNEISVQLKQMGFEENVHFWDGYSIFFSQVNYD